MIIRIDKYRKIYTLVLSDFDLESQVNLHMV